MELVWRYRHAAQLFMVFSMILWHHCHPRVDVSGALLLLCFTFLYFLLLMLSSPVSFGVLNICHKDGAICSFGQGTTSGLPYIRKRQRRRSASLMFWVKFFYTAGVSLSRDMVVKRSPSEGLSLMYTHSSINAFFQGLTDWDLLYKQMILCVAFPFLWSYQVLVWHHCHQVITSFSARQSRLFAVFSLVDVPSRW